MAPESSVENLPGTVSFSEVEASGPREVGKVWAKIAFWTLVTGGGIGAVIFFLEH